ncbi:MAG: T9SS type A sorting domain-containing protein [Flavisolibacter sp.]|nr:T9SS type A sorting domain-containing protein [Flavisolibacter sp.]
MTKRIFVWLLLSLCSFQFVKSQTLINDKVDILPGSSVYYLNEVIYKPANFSTSQKYPLVIFFHGMGEAGTNINALYNTGLPKVLKNGYKPSFDFIMVAPQATSYSLDPKYLQQVLDDAIARFPNIDQSRIYITGLSAGGWAAYGSQLNVDTNLAKKIAAIVVMSGATQDANKTNIGWWKTSKTPLWAVVGNVDVSYRDQNQDMVNKINALVPGLASITIREGVGHGGWDDVYSGLVKTANGKTMWDWMYQFTRTTSGSASQLAPTNTPPTVNAGTDRTITLPVSSVQLSATASDAEGAIASYSWSKVNGPSQFSFSSTSIASPTVSNLIQGTYTFRLTVTDNQGATAYDDVNITVNAAAATSSPAKYIKVNVYGGSNAYTDAQWNNWNVASSLSSGTFKYSDGTSSAVSATLSQQSGVADNGPSYTATMTPGEVIRYASYSTSNRTLTISGLDNSKTYNLELYASRSGASNNTTRFTIGSTSVDIKTDDNTSTKAAFTSLVPSNGQITISLSKLNTYNYINGWMLTENASGTVSATSKSAEEMTVLSTEFNVYPNPVEDRFVLQLNNSNTGKMKVQVIDISGVTQKEFNLSKNQTGALQTYLSIGDLKAGVYIIRVQIGEWIETKKISKL